MTILGNFRQHLCKKYQSDPLDILGGLRYMPSKSCFALFLSLKLLKCGKTAKYAFYMIKVKKVEKIPTSQNFPDPPSKRKLTVRVLKRSDFI